jgi:hypothetical protein
MCIVQVDELCIAYVCVQTYGIAFFTASHRSGIGFRPVPIFSSIPLCIAGGGGVSGGNLAFPASSLPLKCPPPGFDQDCQYSLYSCSRRGGGVSSGNLAFPASSLPLCIGMIIPMKSRKAFVSTLSRGRVIGWLHSRSSQHILIPVKTPNTW